MPSAPRVYVPASGACRHQVEQVWEVVVALLGLQGLDGIRLLVARETLCVAKQVERLMRIGKHSF